LRDQEAVLSALAFPDPLTGGPQERAALYRRYKATLKAAHLDTTHRFHDLRHTYGTRMAAQGVAMRTLQEWMGHRDIKTTERYADYAPSPHEDAMAEAAFARDTVPDTLLSQTESNVEQLRSMNRGDKDVPEAA
jgi:integrase